MQPKKQAKLRKNEFPYKIISVRTKLWLEVEGKPFFGEGRVELLKGIEKYGSINQAAKGANGGGTQLSKEAKGLS